MVEVIEELQGVVLQKYPLIIFNLEQIKFVTWNPKFQEVGTRIHLSAVKEGFAPSESFTFTVTDETPISGLLFEHTFTLDRETIELPVQIFGESRTVEWNDRDHLIEISSSSEILDLGFNESGIIRVEVREAGITGFLNFSIPTTLMEGPFTVLFDNTLIHSFSEIRTGEITVLGLTYPVGGTHDISILGTMVLELDLVAELILVLLDDSIKLGDVISVQGRIEPPGVQNDVTLTYTDPEGSMSTHQVTTLADGVFLDTFIPNKTGAWSVIALHSIGDVTVRSIPQIFSVEPSVELGEQSDDVESDEGVQSPFSISLIVIIGVIVILAILTSLFVLRRRSAASTK